MFANLDAITMLVTADTAASKEEKQLVVKALEGKDANVALTERLRTTAVMSFGEVAKVLGYKSSRGVYAAVRNGRLRGFYCGPDRRRASGVLTESVNEVLRAGKGVSGK